MMGSISTDISRVAIVTILLGGFWPFRVCVAAPCIDIAVVTTSSGGELLDILDALEGTGKFNSIASMGATDVGVIEDHPERFDALFSYQNGPLYGHDGAIPGQLRLGVTFENYRLTGGGHCSRTWVFNVPFGTSRAVL